MATENEDYNKIPELVDELVSYLWGVFLLTGLSALMLLFHIFIDIWFHN